MAGGAYSFLNLDDLQWFGEKRLYCAQERGDFCSQSTFFVVLLQPTGDKPDTSQPKWHVAIFCIFASLTHAFIGDMPLSETAFTDVYR